MAAAGAFQALTNSRDKRMPNEKNSGASPSEDPAEQALDEDLAVQGTEPDDRQDAAVALGTAPPPTPEQEAFVGGGEVDWASLERERARGSE